MTTITKEDLLKNCQTGDILLYNSKTIMGRLQVTCNKLLKVLLKKNTLYSTDKLYSECKLLKVEDLYTYSVLQFVHRCIYDEKSPDVMNSYFVLNSRLHNRNTRDNLIIHIPRINSAMGASGIYWYGASEWNKLPYSLRNQPDLLEFKKCLKEALLATYGYYI